MILLILVIVVVAVLAAGGAGLLGTGVSSAGDRRRGPGLLPALSVPVVLVVGAVLAAMLVVGAGGMRSGDDHGTDATPAPPAPDGPRTAGTEPPLPARVLSRAASTPTIVMEVGREDEFPPYQPLSGLTPGAVVRVRVDGFGWHEQGSARQCVVELGRQTACGEPFPVQFDAAGRGDFQFAVSGDIAPGGCRAGQPTCLLRVTGERPGREVSVQTVLVDVLRPGRVTLQPAGAVGDGETIEVSVSGFPPATTATAVLCAPPTLYDARRCGRPEPTATFAIDAAGAGSTTLTVGAGRLGSDAALCGPRRTCGIAVVVGDGFIAAPVTEVRFSRGPGVAYDARRVLSGVGLAVVLLGAATAMARRTDWRAPEEAATPELDGSDLRTGQSLDDLFGTDRELDERDPILW